LKGKKIFLKYVKINITLPDPAKRGATVEPV
jgi:hypothetical protein